MELRRYWRLLLFITVLIVPSILVAWEGWRNVKLDRDKRLNDAVAVAAEARLHAQKEIGLEAWELLQDIQMQLTSENPRKDPAVKLVAWDAGGKLVMPWETDPNAESVRRVPENSAFATSMDEADFAESFEKRPERAIAIYRNLLRSAGSDWQHADVRLRLARLLATAPVNSEADLLYRELLRLPSGVVDREGYSYASIAAAALVGRSDREVSARVGQELESPIMMTLGQAYRWRSVVEILRSTNIAAVKEEAKRHLEKISEQIQRIEQAQEQAGTDSDIQHLRADYPGQGITARSWLPYGTNLLISRIPAVNGFRSLVMVVRRDVVFDTVRSARESGPTFVVQAGGPGESLDEQHFPGLKISFPSPPDSTQASLDLRPSFYLPVIVLVLSLNLLGAYLLWRDTQREMRIAQLRSQFVSSVSHELKTPLTSIRMFAEILQTKDSVDEQTKAECLGTIVHESERLTRLLNNVLDFARVERGEQAYRMESIHLPEVVAAAAKTIQYPLTEQGFNLRLCVDDKTPPVKADRDALKQAVLNLLTNAMKYSGQSRGIELRLFPQDGHALIEVQDHGIGIPEDEQPRIFQQFYRAHVPENHAISGTGLGLALVAHIVHGHGGSIHVESCPGQGSTFSIRLPLYEGSAA